MSSPTPTDKHRDQMQKRFDRANRRLGNLEGLLSKAIESDPAKKLSEKLAVEDDFAHIISEMKNVMHEFGAWCSATGSPKTGNIRMNHWSANTLSPEDQDVWKCVREIRDFDIHVKPISPERKPATLFLKAGGLTYAIQWASCFVDFVMNDGSRKELQLPKFCKDASRILQKFIAEFEHL